MNHQSENHINDHPPHVDFISFAFKSIEVLFGFVLFQTPEPPSSVSSLLGLQSAFAIL